MLHNLQITCKVSYAIVTDLFLQKYKFKNKTMTTSITATHLNLRDKLAQTDVNYDLNKPV